MIVIALSAAKNSGKTKTLLSLIEKLKKNELFKICDEFKSSNGKDSDERIVFETKDSKKICICTAGDNYMSIIEENFAYVKNHKADCFVTAVHTPKSVSWEKLSNFVEESKGQMISINKTFAWNIIDSEKSDEELIVCANSIDCEHIENLLLSWGIK